MQQPFIQVALLVVPLSTAAFERPRDGMWLLLRSEEHQLCFDGGDVSPQQRIRHSTAMLPRVEMFVLQ